MVFNIFQHLFEKGFRVTSQNFNSIRQPIKKTECNNCLNELKFCEVSRISILNLEFVIGISWKNVVVLTLSDSVAWLFWKPCELEEAEVRSEQMTNPKTSITPENNQKWSKMVRNSQKLSKICFYVQYNHCVQVQ